MNSAILYCQVVRVWGYVIWPIYWSSRSQESWNSSRHRHFGWGFCPPGSCNQEFRPFPLPTPNSVPLQPGRINHALGMWTLPIKPNDCWCPGLLRRQWCRCSSSHLRADLRVIEEERLPSSMKSAVLGMGGYELRTSASGGPNEIRVMVSHMKGDTHCALGL